MEFNKDNLQIDMEIGLLPFIGGSIAAVLRPSGDAAEKFGIKGLRCDDLVFSVVAFTDGHFLTAQYSADTDRGKEHYQYEPTQAETELFWELLEDCCRRKYGCPLEEFLGVFQHRSQGKSRVAQN